VHEFHRVLAHEDAQVVLGLGQHPVRVDQLEPAPVAVRPQGQRRLYAVRPEGLAGLRDFLAEFWPEQLEDLKRAVESGDDR